VATLEKAILDGFAAHDLLEACAEDEKLLAMRLRPSADARLDRIYLPAEDGWHVESIRLRRESAMPFQLGLERLWRSSSGCSTASAPRARRFRRLPASPTRPGKGPLRIAGNAAQIHRMRLPGRGIKPVAKLRTFRFF